MKAIRKYESFSLSLRYSKYRPTYPKKLLEKVFAFTVKHEVGHNIAVDLACGAGQSTFPLCDRFRRVVGVDISKAQIDCAVEKAKTLGKSDDVEFVLCPANHMPFQDDSVDLMTCATAWHWLDPNTVFREIDRVLKRPGALAVYSYNRPVILQKQCEKLFSHFWHNTCVWFHSDVKELVENHYRDVKLPYPLAERYDMQQESTKSLEDLKGYLSSFHSYEDYCKQNPGGTALEDMVLEMKKALLEEDKVPDKNTDITQLSDVTVNINTPFFLLLALKA